MPRRDKVRDAKRKQRASKPRVAPKVENSKKPQASTPNGKLIQDLMVERKVKGSYKDYVIIVGNRLVDWTDSWDIFGANGKPAGVDGVALIHKSRLRSVIDSPLVDKLWHPKWGHRVQKAPQKA